MEVAQREGVKGEQRAVSRRAAKYLYIHILSYIPSCIAPNRLGSWLMGIAVGGGAGMI
jgi:hypothetical protein